MSPPIPPIRADDTAAQPQGSRVGSPSALPLALPPPKGHISEARNRYILRQFASIFDTGGSAADARQFYDLEMKQPFSTKPVPIEQVELEVPSYLRGLSMAVVQGATLGFGDEGVGGALGILTGIGARAGIDQYRAEHKAWADEHKYANLAGEAFGTLLTGGVNLEALTAKEGLTAVRGATVAMREAIRARNAAAVARVAASASGAGLGRVALQGAAAGAVQAAGDADNASVPERLKAAVFGGGSGLVAAPVVVGVGRLATPIARPLAKTVVGWLPQKAQRILAIGPPARAREMLARTLASEGIDHMELQSFVHEMQSLGVPITIGDVSEAAQGLIVDAAKHMSPERVALMQGLEARMAKQGERMSGSVFERLVRNKHFGLANAHEAEDILHEAGAKMSEPFYNEAHEQVVRLPAHLVDHMNDPVLREAYNLGASETQRADKFGMGHGLRVETLADKGGIVDALRAGGFFSASPASQAAAEGIAKAAGGGDVAELPVRGIDYMKRNINAAVQRIMERRAKTGTTPFVYDKDVTNKALYEIVDEARRQVGSYGLALDTYAGFRGAKEAVLAGKEFHKLAPHEIAKEIATRSPAERDFYRIGVAQHLHDAASQSTSPDVTRLFGGDPIGRETWQTRQIRALFPGGEAAATEFMRVVAGESLISRATGRMVSEPSAIGVERIEEAAQGAMPHVRARLGVAVVAAAREGLQRVAHKLSQEDAKEVVSLAARGLTNPGDLSLLLKDLHYTYNRLGYTKAYVEKIGRLKELLLSSKKRAALRAGTLVGARAGALGASILGHGAVPSDESVEPDIERR